MQKRNWTVGVDVGCEVTQVSYMTEGMREPETLEQLFLAESEEEMESFLQRCLLEIPGLDDIREIQSLEVVLSEFTSAQADRVKEACKKLGIGENAIHFQGRAEAAICFVLSQEPSLWNHDVILFDFSKEGLLYRSLHVEQKKGSLTAWLTEEWMEEMDMEQPSDEDFLRLARERMEKRVISAVYLVGEGFYGEEWAKESLRYLCSRRRVFKGLNLYTKGAAFAAYDGIHSREYEKVLFLCRDCLKASVGLSVIHRGEPRFLYLVRAGMNWYEAQALIEVIPDEIMSFQLVLQSWDGKERKEEISLEAFPVRERRMTRLEINLTFRDEKNGVLTLRDLGFGSLIPATDIVVSKEIQIAEEAEREQEV